MAYDHKDDEDEDDYFSIIRKCKRHNIKQENYECHHTNEERGWVGVYTHYEIILALQRGYKVTHLLHSWQWKKWSTNIFTE